MPVREILPDEENMSSKNVYAQDFDSMCAKKKHIVPQNVLRLHDCVTYMYIKHSELACIQKRMAVVSAMANKSI